MPVTIPDASTVARVVLLLLHVPPGVALERVMVLPTLTDDGPVMVPADGAVSTLTTAVAMQPVVAR